MRRKAMMLAIAASLLSGVAHGLSGDRDQPIHIQADRVELDERNKVSTYQGNVVLTQGSIRLQAEQLVVHRDGEGVGQIVADGDPAEFRQRPDDGAEIVGQAQQLRYTASDSRVQLIGDARLTQGEDLFAGPRIVYDTERSLVRAGSESGEGRVRAIINPATEQAKP